MTGAPNLYTRWTALRSSRRVRADLLGAGESLIEYDTEAGEVSVAIGTTATPAFVDPDTARMYGVRLIEAATRAEADRRFRA